MVNRVAFICGNIYTLLADSGGTVHMGGAEVQQLLLGEEFRKHGLEVTYVTEVPVRHADRLAPQWADCGFAILGYRLSRNKVRQLFSFLRALWQAPCDLYYFRGVSINVIWPRLIAWLRGRQYVIAIASDRAVFPGKVAGYSGLESTVYGMALRTASAVVAQSEFQAQMLRKNYGVASSRLSVIYNGAVATPRPVSYGALDSRVVWLATVHPRKRVEAVFELATILPHLRFVIGGGPARGEDAYLERIAEQATSFANVEWRGFIAREDVDELVRGALALVNTTADYWGAPGMEGFPNVYLEAWRNGVPTLTCHYDPDGVMESEGIGFRSGSVAQMAEGLRRLAEDPELRRTMGERARLHFERRHEIAQVAQQYLDLFRQLS